MSGMSSRMLSAEPREPPLQWPRSRLWSGAGHTRSGERWRENDEERNKDPNTTDAAAAAMSTPCPRIPTIRRHQIENASAGALNTNSTHTMTRPACQQLMDLTETGGRQQNKNRQSTRTLEYKLHT